MTGRALTMNGHRWRIASVHDSAPYDWAWLVRVDRLEQQVRLSMRAIFP